MEYWFVGVAWKVWPKISLMDIKHKHIWTQISFTCNMVPLTPAFTTPHTHTVLIGYWFNTAADIRSISASLVFLSLLWLLCGKVKTHPLRYGIFGLARTKMKFIFFNLFEQWVFCRGDSERCTATLSSQYFFFDMIAFFSPLQSKLAKAEVIRRS